MQQALRREATEFEVAQLRDVRLGDGEVFDDTRLHQLSVYAEVVEANGELGKKVPSFCVCSSATQPRVDLDAFPAESNTQG